MYIVVERLIDHVAEVTAFGTVTIVVLSPVVVGFHGLMKQVLRFLYLITDSRQICQLKRRPILVNQVLQ